MLVEGIRSELEERISKFDEERQLKDIGLIYLACVTSVSLQRIYFFRILAWIEKTSSSRASHGKKTKNGDGVRYLFLFCICILSILGRVLSLTSFPYVLSSSTCYETTIFRKIGLL